MIARSAELELLDVETPTRRELDRLAGYFAFVNRWLGGLRAVAHRLREIPDARVVLDVGAGTADLPRALARRFPALRPVVLDRSVTFLARAADLPRVLGDARRLPFVAGSVDVVIATHLFHHLTDDEAVAALREFDRIARRGIVVNDLLRRRRAVLWITILTLFANRFAKFDGPLSVKRGFTLAGRRPRA